jgi:hypothetical protein
MESQGALDHICVHHHCGHVAISGKVLVHHAILIFLNGNGLKEWYYLGLLYETYRDEPMREQYSIHTVLAVSLRKTASEEIPK